MRKKSVRIIHYGVTTATLVCVVLLIAYKSIHDGYSGQKGEELFSNPNLLMVGSHAIASGDYPFVLSIDTNDFSLSEVNLEMLKNSSVSGFHEARPFMIKDEYKMAVGTYVEGKLLILGSSDPYFSNLHVELDEAFEGERVRAVFPGDIDGDGQEEVVIGTRPGGIVKYYTYHDGAWTGSEIDKIGMAVHDVLIANLDGNGNKEIYVTASTTSEFNSYNLPLKTPEIIKYTFLKGVWDKKVVWKPEEPTPQDRLPHLYTHPRYIRTGDFTGNGHPQLVSGVIGNPFLTGLLLLTWNGSGYSHYFQAIEDGITASTAVITSGDIDNDGKDEILLPTFTGDAMLLYTWQGNTWEQSVIAKDLVDKTMYNETIMSMAMLNSVSDGYQKILYVTANGDRKSGENPKFYTLSYSSAKQEWVKIFVASPSLPMMETWGMFPMSPWKVLPTSIP